MVSVGFHCTITVRPKLTTRGIDQILMFAIRVKRDHLKVRGVIYVTLWAVANLSALKGVVWT